MEELKSLDLMACQKGRPFTRIARIISTPTLIISMTKHWMVRYLPIFQLQQRHCIEYGMSRASQVGGRNQSLSGQYKLAAAGVPCIRNHVMCLHYSWPNPNKTQNRTQNKTQNKKSLDNTPLHDEKMFRIINSWCPGMWCCGYGIK